MTPKKRPPPRCQYRAIVHNKLTGDTGSFQCGGAGTNRYEMCSDPGKASRQNNLFSVGCHFGARL